MDMKIHMLICLLISMLLGMERDEIIIRIKNNYQEMNEVSIRIKGSYYEGSEVVRLGIEVVTLENVSRIVLGQPYKGIRKINKELMKDYKKPPIYRFL